MSIPTNTYPPSTTATPTTVASTSVVASDPTATHAIQQVSKGTQLLTSLGVIAMFTYGTLLLSL